MKKGKVLALVLSLLMLASMLSVTALARGYSTTSTKGDELQYPQWDDYLSVVKTATVKASRSNGSIYLIPMPESGHGNLGNVRNGKTVYIVAKCNGYYFFMTEDGHLGWNGTKYFKVTGTADWEDVLDLADTQENYEIYGTGEFFYFLDYLYAYADGCLD